MPDLRRYRDKRDPEATPEPFGDERARRAPGPDVAGTAVADADPEPVSPTR